MSFSIYPASIYVLISNLVGHQNYQETFLKEIKNASQISQPCLPAAGPGNLCDTLEVGLVSDVQLGWKLLYTPPNLSESSEGVFLQLFEMPGVHKEGLEHQTQNSGVPSIHQHTVTSYEKFKTAPRLNDTND